MNAIALKSTSNVVKSPAILRCRDVGSIRASLTTLRALTYPGATLDCSGATFVDPGFVVLLHHLWSVSLQKGQGSLVVTLPTHPAAFDYMLKHLDASNPSRVELRLPTDFPLRRISQELLVVSEIGAWRKMLIDCSVPEEEARSFSAIMSEVLTNVFQHGGTLPQSPIIAGQTFTKHAHSTLIAVDQGQSIPGSLRASGRYPQYAALPDHSLIEAALERGVTARTRPTNRGIGLFHLRNRVVANGGSLYIVSGNGVLALHNGVIRTQPLGNRYFPSFPGTMLILDVKRAKP